MKRKTPTQGEWLLLAASFLPGPVLGFSFAFDPGTCNPHFSDLNFVLLLLLATATSLASLYCLKRAVFG